MAMVRTPTRPNGPGAPGVPRAQSISADQVGGDAARQLGQLGDAALKASMTWTDIAQRADTEFKEAAGREEYSLYMKAMSEARTRIQTEHVGSNAEKAPELMRQEAERLAEQSLGRLKSEHSKKIFNQQRQNFDVQNAIVMDTHAIQQAHQANQQAIAANIQDEIDKTILDAGNTRSLQESMGKVQEMYEQMMAGSPPNVISQQVRTAHLAMVEGTAKRIAEGAGAQAALAFLDSEAVRSLDPKAGGEEQGEGAEKSVAALKLETMRKKYSDAAELEIDVQWARNMAEFDLPTSEAVALIREQYKDDPERAELVIGMTTQLKQNKTNLENLQRAETITAVHRDFISGGYDINVIPVDFQKEFPGETRRMVDLANWYHGTGKDLDPHIEWVENMLDLSPNELRAWAFKDGSDENYETLLKKCGKDKDRIERVHQRLTEGTEGGNAAAVAGKSAGGFNSKKVFIDAYQSLYGVEYEPENAAEQLNAFTIEFDARVARIEGDGSKATDEQKQKITVDILSEIRQGNVALESKIHKEEATPDTPAEKPLISQDMTLTAKDLSNEELEHYDNGKLFASVDSATGEVHKFEAIPEAKWLDDIKGSAHTSVRAITGGEVGGYAYEPTDIIVQEKDGMFRIYDKLGHQKYEPKISDNNLAKLLERHSTKKEVQAKEHPEPKKSNVMVLLEKDQGVKFTWIGEAKLWTADYPSGVRKFFSENGSERRGSVQYLGPDLPNPKSKSKEETWRERYDAANARMAKLVKERHKEQNPLPTAWYQTILGMKSANVNHIRIKHLDREIEAAQAQIDAVIREYGELSGGDQ